MGGAAAEESAVCGAGAGDADRRGGEDRAISAAGGERRERQGVVGVQPSLGGTGGAAGGSARAGEPLPANALGALLAGELRRAGGFYSAARRSGELAAGAASVLGQLF